MTDSNFIIPECKRILTMIDKINRKTTKEDIHKILTEVRETTKNWLHQDSFLVDYLDCLCVDSNNREFLQHSIQMFRGRLIVIVNNSANFGTKTWDYENKTIAHIFTKSEDIKTIEALNAIYSQHLADWL